MGLYEVLKAAKIGAASDVFTTLRGQQAPFAKGGSTEHEYTGTVPYTFSANGEPLLDWYIKGNTGGVGERTGNLFDVNNPNIFRGYYNTTTNSLAGNANNAFIYIPLVQGKKYYIYGAKRYNTSITLRWVTTSSTPFYEVPCIRTGTFAQTDIFTITAETNENYLAIFLCGDSDYTAYGTVEDAIATNGANLSIDNGYKIPVTCGGETKTIYLDEPLGASDSISMTDTGISIPTVDGSNTLSVGTTVQPSEVYIKWKG